MVGAVRAEGELRRGNDEPSIISLLPAQVKGKLRLRLKAQQQQHAPCMLQLRSSCRLTAGWPAPTQQQTVGAQKEKGTGGSCVLY